MSVESDLHTRWVPSDQQMRLAEAVLSAYEDASDLYVSVPLVLRNKVEHFWTTDVVVEPIEGVAVVGFGGYDRDHPAGVLGYHEANEHVARIAASLITEGERATPSYATIDVNGRAAMWEAAWLVRD